MSKVIGGTTYYHVSGALVVNGQADPQENLTGGQVYAVEGGSALLLAEYPSGVPVASVSTSALGFTPDLYVAFPDGPLEGFVDWPDDNVPAQPISATAAEIGAWLRSYATADAAQLAADAAASRDAAEAVEQRLTEIRDAEAGRVYYASAVLMTDGSTVPIRGIYEGEPKPSGPAVYVELER